MDKTSETDSGKSPSLITFIDRLGLIPPNLKKEKQTTESELAIWWTTRVGSLLAVIAMVFFGIHINEGVTPLVRLCQLAAISLSVFFSGVWLVRRHKELGQHLLSAGTGMIYFTAFAAYGLEAVQIIKQPVIAVTVQFFTAIILLTISILRRSEQAAFLTLSLATITCIFSLIEGLSYYAYLGSFSLAITGISIHFIKRWSAVWLVGVIAPLAVYLVSLALENPARIGLGMDLEVAFAASSLFLLVCSDIVSKIFKAQISHTLRHWFVPILAGSWTATIGLRLWSEAPEQLGLFYLIGMSFYSAMYLIYRYVTNEDSKFREFWWINTVVFTLLFLVDTFDGPSLWFALLLQAIGMTYYNRKDFKYWKDCLNWIPGLLAYFYFSKSGLSQGTHSTILTAPLSEVLFGYAFLLGFGLWLMARFVWIDPKRDGSIYLMRGDLFFGSFILGLGAILFNTGTFHEPHLFGSAVNLVSYIGLGILAWRMRIHFPLIAGGMMFLASLVHHTLSVDDQWPIFSTILALSQIVALFVTLWITYIQYEQSQKDECPTWITGMVHLLTVGIITFVGSTFFRPEWVLARKLHKKLSLVA